MSSSSRTSCVLVLFALLAPLCQANVDAKDVLKMRFGLEGTEFHQEKQAVLTAKEVNKVGKSNQTRVRFFASTAALSKELAEMSERHFQLWEILKKEYGTKDLTLDQDAYANEIRKHDLYLTGQINRVAPQLYFDFTTDSGAQYVLDAINIRTLAFEEYRGGGWFNGEGQYHIRLRHMPGTHSYSPSKRLRFTSSGRVVLRFFSDNWYQTVGLTPQGCYTIDITFVFSANGKNETVSTGAFKIDV
jgi:hypothetical protein